MKIYTVRVELNDPASGDYDDLHKKMMTAGFSKTIESSEGIVYHLPDAEYEFKSETETIRTVLDKAYQVATGIKSGSRVLVTESAGRMWKGLKKV
ncbi:DUF2622 domain-containing protein [Enterobacter asburiae]|uniref:DUF2622 domain-containing protein n=1 Tax=Enterobacter asburiae TaxID=61645 RepID=UPI00214741B3|nr:DUF2622 domain-containing protein [Enterobacter asburiae]UUR73853.1 DUF2622 domain-containing protein [Enterobacter asburiae]